MEAIVFVVFLQIPIPARYSESDREASGGMKLGSENIPRHNFMS